MRGAVLLSLLVLAITGVRHGDCVRILQPSDNEPLEFIPDIPLWVRLDRREGECFDFVLDGQSETISCDADTILSARPEPGEHTLELIPTFLASTSGPMAAVTFRVVAEPGSLHDPKHIPSLPDAVEAYHKWAHGTGVWVHTKWRGVTSHKFPTDMWNYQEILHTLQPVIVLELGTRFGGTTLFFSDVMKHVHSSSGRPYRILTVDIDRSSIDDQVFSEPNVEILSAPSASLRMQERVRELRQGYEGPMFVIHDADHGEMNVTLELQMVAPVLRDGDYVIVEDSNLDGHDKAVAPGWGPSPYDAIVNYMAMNRGLFARDLQREFKFGFSQSVNGFLVVRGAGKKPLVNPEPTNPYLDM
jgi:cephalosporin hydroxylase